MCLIDLGSSTIYYESKGTGDPVVLVHGFSLDHRMWQPQINFLFCGDWVPLYDEVKDLESRVKSQL